MAGTPAPSTAVTGTATPGPAATRDRFFADDLGAHRRRTALVAGGRALTYAELDDRVAELAGRLGRRRRLVVLGAANQVDAVVAYLAALRGRHPVVLVAGGDDDALAAVAAAYDPDVVMAPATGWDLDQRRRRPAHDLNPDLALLLPTSGSTGAAKLVRLSRANLQANAEAIAGYLGLTPGDRAATTLPLQYCYGLSVLHSHLASGASLVLTGLSVVDTCFWELFRASGATSFAGVPHTFDLLDRAGFESVSPSLPALRYVTQAGGRLPPDTVRRYAALGRRDDWELFVMYGQTEATARMAYLPPALAPTHPHTIGVAVPGGSLAVEEAGEDGVGELVYRGPNVMLGYAEGPADLALGPTLDALRTGDLARVTPEGLYEVVGRRSRFLKLFGLRVDLDHLERWLAGEGSPALCTGDDHGLAVAVGPGADAEAVRAAVGGHVGLSRSRVHVVALDPWPRLANGKPDYPAVQRRVAHDLGGAESPGPLAGSAPSSAAAVRAAFAEVLGTAPADGDSFAGLGGDSLSYVEMSIRLEEILGPLPADWPTLPVARLAGIRARRRALVAATDTGVVIRAVAIVLVVGNHTDLWHLLGGAHTMLAVAGFNFARFLVRAGSMVAGVARLALPCMAWIAAVAVATDDFGWRHALLLNGVVGEPGARWTYWYVEALVQILVALALLLAVPAVRRLERRRPLLLPLAVAGAGLAVRFGALGLLGLPEPHHRFFRPWEVLWVFALGWAAARATTTAGRLAVSAVTVAAVPGSFGGNVNREATVMIGLLLLVWVRHLPVPRPAHRLLGAVAGASLFVYLSHPQVYPPVVDRLGPAAGVVASVVVGTAAWAVGRRVMAASGALGGAARGRRRRPAPV